MASKIIYIYIGKFHENFLIVDWAITEGKVKSGRTSCVKFLLYRWVSNKEQRLWHDKQQTWILPRNINPWTSALITYAIRLWTTGSPIGLSEREARGGKYWLDQIFSKVIYILSYQLIVMRVFAYVRNHKKTERTMMWAWSELLM